MNWKVGHGQVVELGASACLMGILNVTPDSFSDGGRYLDPGAAVAQAHRLADAGARIVDIGGESTRPGAVAVSAEEEQRRVLPVIRALAGSGIVLSIDTYRASTARAAVKAGAHIVNDVWGAQREPEIAKVAAETGAGFCLMHTSRERETLADPIADQIVFLQRSLEIAAEAGVRKEAIVLDPGFGFGKGPKECFALMRRFSELPRALPYPWLVGTSRKRFVRQTVGEKGEADIGTAATSALLRLSGASIFRVHDVEANRDALAIADAVLAAPEAGT